MDYFDTDFQFQDIPSIAPDLMFGEHPSSPVKETKKLTPLDRNVIIQFVFDDHAYAKPYPILSTSNNKSLTPRTVLRLHSKDLAPKKKSKKKVKQISFDSEDDVDVVSVNKTDDLLIKYDGSKARHVMNEVEAYLNSLWKDVDKDDEEKIVRGSWSKEQARLFDSTYKATNNYQLAKLAYAKNINEPVLRKLALEKATKRFRKSFGSAMWNPKFIVWLHGIMIDGLGSSLFLCYLEILQSLKRKVPSLFERVLLSDKAASEKEMSAGLPQLGSRLRKSWEPSVGLHTKVVLEKFPTAPFLITIPSGPSVPHQSTKRNRFWNNQLMNFGKAIPISVPAYRTPEGYVIKYYLEHCISAVRGKIVEFRNRFPDRHVVLLGWGVGSLVACKVATLDKVDAVVCLGFPCNSMEEDNAQDFWAGLVQIECPVLYVIGTHALSNSIDRTEELREKMKTQTNLIVMESGDELLRLTKSQKRILGMTQNMVDKLIQDEIYLFLKSVLFKPKSAVCAPLVKGNQPKKRKKKVEDGEGGETKKKKKNLKADAVLSVKTSDNSSMLQPLVASSASTSSQLGDQGLLTTGSISTIIPVTQLQSETLISGNVRVVGSNVGANELKSVDQKPSVKRSLKDKPKKVRHSKKTGGQRIGQVLNSSQKFTANLGNQRSGNLSGQRFSSGELGFIATTNSQPQMTLQRAPSGTFILSGASGQVRLQGGTNIVYLQQATSGATQLIQTPIIASSSGTLLSTSTVGASPSLISLVQQGNNTSHSVGRKTALYLNQSKSSGTSNAAKTSSSEASIASAEISIAASDKSEHKSATNLLPVVTCAALGNVASPVHHHTTTSSSSGVTTSTILTHLSANDLRYLASLIAKHSTSRPDSPQLSPAPTTVTYQTLKVDNVKSEGNPISPTGKEVPETTKSVSQSDIKTPLPGLHPLRNITYPSPLGQKVASAQLKDVIKTKPPPLKPPRISTTAASFIRANITPTSMSPTRITANISSEKSVRKVPVTLTIPISRLPTNLNLISSSATSKGINVPALSAYLAQQKFVLSTTKSSSLSSGKTSVLLSPNVGRKLVTVSTNISSKTTTSITNVHLKNSVLTSPVLSSKSAVKGTATITLHLPNQALLKDPKVLKKAASDIKLVGVLSQQSKPGISSPVNFSTLRSSSVPRTPHKTTPEDDFSPIQPRSIEEAGEGNKSDKNVVPTKYLVGPKSNIEALQISSSVSVSSSSPALSTTTTTTTTTTEQSQAGASIDDSDVDFAVTPTSSKISYASNKPVTPDASRHVINVAKLLQATPVGISVRTNKTAQPAFSGFSNGKGFSRSLIELAKTRMQDTGNTVDAKKLLKSAETLEGSGQVAKSDAKLRFEPLKVTSNRSNLTSVLSSMRETGKIIVDENGKMRTTIVAKPTMVNSKTAALIAKTAFSTSTPISLSKFNYTAASTLSTNVKLSPTPVSFKHPAPSSIVKNTVPVNTKLVSVVPKKVLPVTIKANDVIRMTTPARIDIPNNRPSLPKEAVQSPTKKFCNDTMITKVTKSPKIVTEEKDDASEPVPYVTRSGRVLRNRPSFADELDKRTVPRKRRRTNSSSKEDANQLAFSPSKCTEAPQCSTLDSLLEAAKLIKNDVGNFVNGNVTSQGEQNTDVDTSGANIAASAMLELLTSESKQVVDSSVSGENLNIKSDHETVPKVTVSFMDELKEDVMLVEGKDLKSRSLESIDREEKICGGELKGEE